MMTQEQIEFWRNAIPLILVLLAGGWAFSWCRSIRIRAEKRDRHERAHSRRDEEKRKRATEEQREWDRQTRKLERRDRLSPDQRIAEDVKLALNIRRQREREEARLLRARSRY